MNRKEIFEKKGFDLKSIEFLNNFLYEFNDLFGKYLSEEEVLKRINDYLDEIEFVDELKNALGMYSHGEKKVYVKKINSEIEKSVFFHEMVHVIYNKIEDSMCKKRIEEDSDFIMEESDKLYLISPGVNEGFTEYLTKKRDEKFFKGKRYETYPILTDQFCILANIVGEEDLIRGMLNSDEQVEMVLQKKLDWKAMDCDEYCESLNMIYLYEEEVLKAKYKSREEKLFEKIFGIKKSLPKDVESAIDKIVKKYLMQTVNTIDDFYSLMENIERYAESFGKNVREEMMIALYQQYKAHPEFKLEEKEPKLCESFEIYNKINELDNLSLEEKIEFLAKDNELKKQILSKDNFFGFKKMVVDRICDDEEYYGFKLNRFVRDNHQFSDYNALYGMLTSGLLQEKIQNGEVKLENLALEWIQSNSSFSAFNMFDVNGKSEKYLGTYSLGGWDYDELTQYEITNLSMEERREQVAKICQNVHNRDMENADLEKYLFVCDKSSKNIIFACSLENQWMNVEDEVIELRKPEYISSITEEEIKKIKRCINGTDMDNIIVLSFLRNAGVIDDTVIDEYLGKAEDQYLTLDDIELEIDRQNISVREIKEKVEEISERLNNKKEGNMLLINGGEAVEK